MAPPLTVVLLLLSMWGKAGRTNEKLKQLASVSPVLQCVVVTSLSLFYYPRAWEVRSLRCPHRPPFTLQSSLSSTLASLWSGRDIVVTSLFHFTMVSVSSDKHWYFTLRGFVAFAQTFQFSESFDTHDNISLREK